MQTGLIKELRTIRTPLVFDALERFNVRPRSEGYSDPSLRCLFPHLEPLVGFACTGKIRGRRPAHPREKGVPWKKLWQYVHDSPKPSVMVVEDLDYPNCRGCAWGDVAASIFMALGCAGVITNGGARDLDQVERLRFPLFAASPIVGHGYIRFVEIGTSVSVAGLKIKPGELIHADRHGALIIPKEVPLAELVLMAREVAKSEARIISYCQKRGFRLEELCRRMERHEERTRGHFR